MLKKSFFRQPIGSQRVNGSQTLLKSERHYFCNTVALIWDILSWIKLILVTSEMLRLFVDTLTDDAKYSRHNIENFPEQIGKQSPQKRKLFLHFSFAFEIYVKKWVFLKRTWV